MLSEVCKALSTLKGNKKSPLLIEIFCQKHDPTPEKSHSKKCSSKTSKKPTSNSDNKDKNWKILCDLHKEHACQEPGHTSATVLIRSAQGRATISEPLPKLKLTFLDKAAKHCGKVVAPPEPVPAPAPAPAPVTGVL
ncbi:hypothetical protein FRC06_002842, partial [Ceratobasidium sp. 370]